MISDDRYLEYLNERGIKTAPPRNSFLGKAWALQITIEERVLTFIRWFGPRSLVMFLSLAFFIWSFVNICFYTFGVVGYPDPFYKYKNGLDYLVRGVAFHDVVKNPLLVFILSGGYFYVFSNIVFEIQNTEKVTRGFFWLILYYLNLFVVSVYAG